MMNWFPKKRPACRRGRIFLDYAAATPVLPEVQKTATRFLANDFHNPSAIYGEGRTARAILEKSRKTVANILGTASFGIVFTSGGTESDNLAILGTFGASRNSLAKPHLVISSIEHPAVTASAEEVVRRGGEVTKLPVDGEGRVSLEALKKSLKKNTFLVSVSLANNELGTLEAISKIGRIIRGYRRARGSEYPYLHTDASQAPNHLDISLERLNVDLMTIDGSKIYGPRGVGVLAMSKQVKIRPITFGGNQERGLRAGTANTALIAGFAKALEIVAEDREKESLRLDAIRNDFVGYIKMALPEALINGSQEHHLPNIVSVSVPGVLSEFVLLKLDHEGVLASAGSACSLDEKEEGSFVIRAIGKARLAQSTIRFSFGRGTKKREAMRAAKIFCRVSKSVLQ